MHLGAVHPFDFNRFVHTLSTHLCPWEMCTGTHLCFSQAHFRTFSALFPPFSVFCSHFSPVTGCFVKINISFGEIRFLSVYSKRDRLAPVSFETVKKVRHCEPVRRLAWQSVSKTHNSCTFPQIPNQKVTDSHTSDIGHWFGMTGAWVYRQAEKRQAHACLFRL